MKKNSIFKKAAGLGLYAFLTTFAAVSFSSCDEEMMEYEGPDGVYLMHYEPIGIGSALKKLTQNICKIEHIIQNIINPNIIINILSNCFLFFLLNK